MPARAATWSSGQDQTSRSPTPCSLPVHLRTCAPRSAAEATDRGRLCVLPVARRARTTSRIALAHAMALSPLMDGPRRRREALAMISTSTVSCYVLARFACLPDSKQTAASLPPSTARPTSPSSRPARCSTLAPVARLAHPSMRVHRSTLTGRWAGRGVRGRASAGTGRRIVALPNHLRNGRSTHSPLKANCAR